MNSTKPQGLHKKQATVLSNLCRTRHHADCPLGCRWDSILVKSQELAISGTWLFSRVVDLEPVCLLDRLWIWFLIGVEQDLNRLRNLRLENCKRFFLCIRHQSDHLNRLGWSSHQCSIRSNLMEGHLSKHSKPEKIKKTTFLKPLNDEIRKYNLLCYAWNEKKFQKTIIKWRVSICADKTHDFFPFFHETDNRPVRSLISANIIVIGKRIDFLSEHVCFRCLFQVCIYRNNNFLSEHIVRTIMKISPA